jgi:ABC-type Fe3+/spermidine/putrescine transport system ATPase subunit
LLDIPSKRYRFKEGDSVKVLVRPEDIEIEKVMAKMKEKNQMTTGKILSMFFSGPFVKISISLGRGLTIRALKPKSEITKKKYKEGDDVFVNISKYKVFPETVDVFITAPVTEILKV